MSPDMPAHDYPVGDTACGTSTEDQWFRALDGQLISTGWDVYPLRVLGVHVTGDDIWIQLAPLHETDRGLLIHCWPEQRSDQILAALSRHLCAQASLPRVIDARSVV
jgi:hypothetical protein